MSETITAFEASVRVAEATGQGLMFAKFPKRLLRRRDDAKSGEQNCYVNADELEHYLSNQTTNNDE